MDTITSKQASEIHALFDDLLYPYSGTEEMRRPFVSLLDRLKPVQQIADVLKGAPISLVARMDTSRDLANLSHKATEERLFSLVKSVGPRAVGLMLDHYCVCYTTYGSRNNKSVYDYPCNVV
jgi:hypothetical protein